MEGNRKEEIKRERERDFSSTWRETETVSVCVSGRDFPCTGPLPRWLQSQELLQEFHLSPREGRAYVLSPSSTAFPEISTRTCKRLQVEQLGCKLVLTWIVSGAGRDKISYTTMLAPILSHSKILESILGNIFYSVTKKSCAL